MAHATQPNTAARPRWPFYSTAHTPLDVTMAGPAVPRRQEVTFADGHSIFLRSVVRDGTADLFLRELEQPAAGVQVDLRTLVPHMADELPVTSTRDVVGYVSYSLRGLFATRDAFIQAAVGHAAA